MAFTFYKNWILRQHNGNADDLDNPATDVKVALVTSAYVPDAATHDFWNDAEANEVSGGTAYVAGGQSVANKTVTLVSGEVRFDHDDVAWAQDAAGPTNARYAIWYVDKGGLTSADPLIGYEDLSTDRSLQAGSLTLQLPATGLWGAS